MYKFQNLNQAFIGMSKELLKKGVSRKTRGFDCVELPEPVLICIENPTDRYINISERKWNKQLGWVESLWIASGTNHMPLVGDYVQNMYSFSDDGNFMRAAYGPRIRAFSGFSSDYKISVPEHRNCYSGKTGVVDQLKFVIESLQRDINSRQAVITIHDPVKDDFDKEGILKITKDTPCCRSIQFQVVDGKLDCTLYIRSNDLVWGFSAVNVFNFTLMQEYVAGILNIPIGRYYHFVNNLHFYKDKIDLIQSVSELNEDDFISEFNYFSYNNNDLTLKEFDSEINDLFYKEKFYRENKIDIPFRNESNFDLFKDWELIFRKKWLGDNSLFINPYLNKLYGY